MLTKASNGVCGSFNNQFPFCLYTEGTQVDRRGNPLHATNASRQYGSDFVKQWIATGYTLAITRYRKEGHPMKS
ncbi:MAG: hypothetical protein P8P49_00825 [Opitutales bacterium]|nr:hypothetical protein [Opitutales bacterium]